MQPIRFQDKRKYLTIQDTGHAEPFKYLQNEAHNYFPFIGTHD